MMRVSSSLSRLVPARSRGSRPQPPLRPSRRGRVTAGLLLALMVPTLAAGVVVAATTDDDGSAAGPTRVVPASQASDPLAATRGALGNTALPLQILAGGMTELTDGSVELDDGAHRLADGLGQARDGGNQLADGMTQLRQGLWQLGDGSTQVSGGVDRVVGALTGVGAAQGQIEVIVQQTLDSVAASTDPAAAATADQLRTVLDLLRTQGLNGGVLADLERLRDGARQVSYQLSDPSSPFVDGIVRATNGSAQLRDGLVQLDDGGVLLVDGTTRLRDGVGPMEGMFTTLRSNVDKASSSLPAVASTEVDPTGSSFVVRPAVANWPYLTAVFAVLAAALVGFLVPRARAAVIGAVGAAATMVLALTFVDTGASLTGSAVATVTVGLWVAAVVTACRAVRLVLGPVVGAAVLALLGLVQVILGGAVLRGASGLLAQAADVTPVGQIVRALTDAVGGAGLPTFVAVLAALATLAVASVVVRRGETPSEAATSDEPDAPAAEKADDEDVVSVP